MRTRVAAGVSLLCVAVGAFGVWAVSTEMTCEHTLNRYPLRVAHSDRPYLLYAAQTPAEQPLVLVFHGGGGPLGNAELMLEHSGWKEVADRECVSVAFLFGTGQNADREVQIDSTQPGYNPLMWNTTKDDTKDIEYVSHVLDDVDSRIEIDHTRIYATGFSNGGTFSYKVAHILPDIFAAIAPVEAAPLDYLQTPSEVSLLVISGVPLNLKHLPETAAVVWASHAECSGNSATKKGTITKRTWHACPQGSVQEIFVHGMGHEYPGAAHLFNTDPRYTDAVSASREIWSFFSDQKRDD